MRNALGIALGAALLLAGADAAPRPRRSLYRPYRYE